MFFNITYNFWIISNVFENFCSCLGEMQKFLSKVEYSERKCFDSFVVFDQKVQAQSISGN